MKRIASTLSCLIVFVASAFAQQPVTNAAPANQPGGTNAAPAAAVNQPGSTNAAPATAEGEAAKAKPDIKELMKLPEFTNSAGMIMVRISDKLWAGKYEVTQEEYKEVAGGNPSQFPGDRNPVESVSWNEALSFCAKLTETESKEEMLPEGFAYTLPTQAQWESFAAGAELKDAVTGLGSRRAGTSPVGSLGATGPGLHDVRGNVWEWCLDPKDKPYRVARGGAWDTFIEINLRPEFRWYSEGPDDSKNSIGFRCVLVPGGK
jgi:formylglycine-generating enzyme required for sulfatase activity